MHRLFRLELLEPNAVMMMTDFKRLELMTDVLPMIIKLLNENEEAFELYDFIGHFFHAKDIHEMLTWYAYFEFYVLEYLGLGLSLDCCAVTGATDGLYYVSPKTGKAVCREVGAPYHDRLFLYPHFVVDKNQSPSYEEIFNVLRMTEFFLKNNFFKFHNLPFPKSRENLWRFYEQEEAPEEIEEKLAAGF
jgi:DNA repair protein RecO (recombination protein O)